jgi:hypothetical protein
LEGKHPLPLAGRRSREDEKVFGLIDHLTRSVGEHPDGECKWPPTLPVQGRIRRAAHGYEPTREAAAAFACWRRES